MSTKRKTILIIGAGISSQVFMSNLDTDNYNAISGLSSNGTL